MDERVQKIFITLYLLLLGISIGAILISGVVVAPVVFHASDYLPLKELSRYESGLIMTQVFVQLNLLLNTTAILVLLYEVFHIRVYGFCYLGSISALIAVVCIVLFTQYYTPYILEAQAQGSTILHSAKFEAMHVGSERDFKFLLVALLVLFCARVYRFVR